MRIRTGTSHKNAPDITKFSIDTSKKRAEFRIQFTQLLPDQDVRYGVQVDSGWVSFNVGRACLANPTHHAVNVRARAYMLLDTRAVDNSKLTDRVRLH